MFKKFLSTLAQQLSAQRVGSDLAGFESTVTLNSKPADSLDDLRERVWLTLSSCDEPNCNRLATQITHANDAAALWALRSDVFQCIARTHGQTHAIERIAQLQSSFAGWLPDKVLAQSSEFGNSGFPPSRR